MSNANGKFIWYDLMTTDVAAAAAFYGAVAGWNARAFPGNHNYHVVSAGEFGIGGIMDLPQPLRDAGAPPSWIGYIAVDDIEAYAKKIEQAGGAMRKPPEDIPTVGRFAAFTDPQGAAFLLFTPAQMDNPPPRPPLHTPGTVGWHELHTKDWEKAYGFYQQLFGWKTLDAMDMGPNGKYQIFATETEMNGAVFNDTQFPPHWLYYINVADIDKAAALVTQNKGKVVNGPMEVPGGMWIAHAIDPQGAAFAMVGRKV